MSKTVFVVGREDTGSTLIARILADMLGCAKFGGWDGVEWCKGQNGNAVFHGSLPNGWYFPDFEKLESEVTGSEIFYVLTTRDATISRFARKKRFGKPEAQEQSEAEKSYEIMNDIILKSNCFVWSYETFMQFGSHYLSKLVGFLKLDDVKSFVLPDLINANEKRIYEMLYET